MAFWANMEVHQSLDVAYEDIRQLEDKDKEE
jgi:hypothetical protein